MVSLDNGGLVAGCRSDPVPPLRGFTLLLTGLAGAGKSTLARRLQDDLKQAGRSQIMILDGEMFRIPTPGDVRAADAGHDIATLRMAVVAEAVTRAGGVAVCAAVAPLDAARSAARRRIEAWGPFILIHLSTPLAVCEQRDRQTLYRDARLGRLSRLSGVTHIYETPGDPDLTIDTSHISMEQASCMVMRRLIREGLVS